MKPDPTKDDYAEESLPPEVGAPAAPERLEFQPWHKPRKQFIRAEQWLHHIKSIVDVLGMDSFKDGEPLRYLTLPGPDLLDVRMIADYCSSLDIRLKYTGFCFSTDSEERRLRQNISEFSLTHNDSIAVNSRVVRLKIQEILQKNSPAAIEMYKGGPFDVINIDACEPLANDGANASGRLVDTIRGITEFQLGSRRKPWLLFLTTPIQIESISAQSLDALHGQVLINAQNDHSFADEISKYFGEAKDLKSYLLEASKTTGDGLISVFSLGIAKWLIHLAEQANFKVIKLKGYSYSMFRKPPYDPNMVSLCFLFEPTKLDIQDNTGLTQNSSPTATTTLPLSNHIRALRKSMSIENLDITLRESPIKYEECAQQTKELLTRVGYSVDDDKNGYDAWLASL